jgi:hypothetical protein
MREGYTPPSRLGEFMSRILHPTAWLMLHRYDPQWDQYVLTAVTLRMIAQVDGDYDHFVGLGQRVVWVGNYPYSYGLRVDDYWVGRGSACRPAWRTIRMLRRAIKQKIEENENDV